MLEMHAAEVERLSGGDSGKAERVKMLAWSRPKQERRRLINALIGLPCNFILCFRAKEKLKVAPGRPPENIGYQPIAAEEFVYEMSAKLLLLPGVDGVPTLKSEFPAERAMIKVPEQFRSIFPVDNPPQLTEGIGEQLARWAAGTPAKPAATSTPSVVDLLDGYAECADAQAFGDLEVRRSAVWKAATSGQKEQLKAAKDAAQARIGGAK